VRAFYTVSYICVGGSIILCIYIDIIYEAWVTSNGGLLSLQRVSGLIYPRHFSVIHELNTQGRLNGGRIPQLSIKNKGIVHQYQAKTSTRIAVLGINHNLTHILIEILSKDIVNVWHLTVCA
jgi:hypothetical protein